MRSRFVALTLIWGSSFLFIKIGITALAPMQVALARMTFGALTLLAILLVRRDRLPAQPRIWGHLAVVGVLANAVPFSLFAYAERHVSSALASIGNATTPLFTLLFALLFLPSERPTWRRTVGLAVGFCGVLVVVGAWRGLAQNPDALGIAIILGAASCYGLSGVYIRRHLSSTSCSSLALSAGQIAVGAVELGLVVPFVTRAPAHVPARVVAAMFALGAFGTGAAYVLSHGLIRRAGATVASMVTYFIPVVSIALGVLVLGERLTWNEPVGAVVIVAGALFSRRQPRAAAAAIAA